MSNDNRPSLQCHKKHFQFSSVPHSCPTLCNPMDYSMSGFSVHYQLLELTQTHDHQSVMPSNHRILYCPLSSWLQSFQESGSFQVSQFFASGGQRIGASASASNLPMNIQDWYPLEQTGLLSFHSKELWSLLQYHSSKPPILHCSSFLIVQLSHPYMTTGKTIASTRQTIVGKVVCLLFNMLSRLVTVFLPRSKYLLISWLQSPSAEILEPPKMKYLTVSIVSPSICHEVMGPDAMILVLTERWALSQLFHSPLSLSSTGSLVLFHFLPYSWCHLHI